MLALHMLHGSRASQLLTHLHKVDAKVGHADKCAVYPLPHDCR